VQGNVGVGTHDPHSKMEVKGAIKIGEDASQCSVDKEGAMRFNPGLKRIEYCNSQKWLALAGSAALGEPDFDSGWQSIQAAERCGGDCVIPHPLTFTHNLNTENYFVYMEGRKPADLNGYRSIHNIALGGDYYLCALPFNYHRGAFWQRKTSNSIEVYRGSADAALENQLYDQVRLRIWRFDQ